VVLNKQNKRNTSDPPPKGGFVVFGNRKQKIYYMASYYNENTFLWLDGKLVKATEAKTDLYGQSLHYGYAVFEGIRSYRTALGETKIFKPVEHYDRLARSAEAYNLPYTYTTQQMIDATYEVLKKNNIQDAYIRPLVYAPANMSFVPNTESYTVIEVWEMAPFFGEKLLKVVTSSFQRPNPKAFKIEAKASGHYVNSIVASHEAKAKGYDECILTDMNGYIAEGTGANVFFEKDGRLFTPATGNILPGITRATVLELCATLDIPVEEGSFTPRDLSRADTAFFCGTAAEVIGWQSYDDHDFPKPWKETLGRRIQLAYKDLVIEKASSSKDQKKHQLETI
jgi:branched-chain amino acid aminotransferase